MVAEEVLTGELTSAQLRGLADIADRFGGGYADITTRSNIQIREVAPKNIIQVLTKLQELGLAVLSVNTRGHDSVFGASLGNVRRRFGAAYETVDDCCHDIAAWIELQLAALDRVAGPVRR